MFGIGGGELIIILLIAFIFIGPDKFPGLAKSFGRGLKGFKDTSSEIKKTIYEEMKDTNLDKINVVTDLQNEIKKAKENLNPISKELNKTIEDVFNDEKS